MCFCVLFSGFLTWTLRKVDPNSLDLFVFTLWIYISNQLIMWRLNVIVITVLSVRTQSFINHLVSSQVFCIHLPIKSLLLRYTNFTINTPNKTGYYIRTSNVQIWSSFAVRWMKFHCLLSKHKFWWKSFTFCVYSVFVTPNSLIRNGNAMLCPG